MGKIDSLLQQAQQMKNKITMLKKELEDREIETSSGGGMVKIRISGKQEILDLKLDRECINPDDTETLENLLKTAVNQAISESQSMVSKAMNDVTGGLNIPGLT